MQARQFAEKIRGPSPNLNQAWALAEHTRTTLSKTTTYVSLNFGRVLHKRGRVRGDTLQSQDCEWDIQSRDWIASVFPSSAWGRGAVNSKPEDNKLDETFEHSRCAEERSRGPRRGSTKHGSAKLPCILDRRRRTNTAKRFPFVEGSWSNPVPQPKSQSSQALSDSKARRENEGLFLWYGLAQDCQAQDCQAPLLWFGPLPARHRARRGAWRGTYHSGLGRHPVPHLSLPPSA